MRGGFLEPIAPLGVLGSQPPVPVIALTGDGPSCALSVRLASQIDIDGRSGSGPSLIMRSFRLPRGSRGSKWGTGQH
jgi:hypothetical protein